MRRMLRTGEARELRISCRLSLAEVGATIGKSGTEVSKYERGQANPRPETALALADLYAELLEVGER